MTFWCPHLQVQVFWVCYRGVFQHRRSTQCLLPICSNGPNSNLCLDHGSLEFFDRSDRHDILQVYNLEYGISLKTGAQGSFPQTELSRCVFMLKNSGKIKRSPVLKVILSSVEGSHLLTPSVCLFDIGVVCFYNMTGIRPIIINDHQSSSIIINDLQSSSMIINHHQSSSMIMPPS